MKPRMERWSIRMMGGSAWLALGAGLLASLAAGGCGASVRPALSPVAPVRPSPRPQPSAGFAEAELASKLAAASIPESAKGTMRISPKLKSGILKALQPSLASMRRSLGSPFAYVYQAPSSMAVDVRERGWTWLLRAQRWELEQAVEKEDWPLAAARTGEALRMGVRLMGGDAGDVMMGASACRWALDEIVPQIKRMGPADRQALYDHALLALADLPSAEDSLANQLDTVLAVLQKLQDAWASQGRQGMVALLGKGARDPGDYLESRPGLAPAFFQGLREEIVMLNSHYTAVAKNPAPLRPAGDPFNPKDSMWLAPGEAKKYRKRPWRELIPFLMVGHRAIAEEMPFIQTRLRLFAITLQAEQALAAGKPAPSGLGAYAESLRTDPYTGQKLGYAAAGAQYKVWSAGIDGVNDGGLIDLGSSSRDYSVRTSSPR